MRLVKVIGFMLLLGIWGQSSAGLEAVVDLDDGTVTTENPADLECSRNCLEVHRIGSYVFYVMWDTKGHMLEPRMFPYREADKGETLYQNTFSDGDGRLSFSPKADQGGTCGADRVNCVLVIRVPGGYILVAWYGPDGIIVSRELLPAKDQQH